MYTERTLHSGLVGFLFLAATLLLVFFHTLPFNKQISEMKRRAAALEQDVGALSGEKGNLSAEQVLSEVEQKEFEQAIPSTLSQDGILADLNRATLATDVAFNALTFSLDPSAEIPTVTISAGFQGTPNSILRFLKLLEGNTRKFVVRDAGVSRTESAGGFELINLSVTLNTFYRNEQ